MVPYPTSKTRKARPLRWIILILALFLMPDSTRADVIHLRNGRKIQGMVLDQNRTHIRVRTGGRIRQYRKKSIRRIRYGALIKAKPPIKKEFRGRVPRARRPLPKTKPAPVKRKAEVARKAPTKTRPPVARRATPDNGFDTAFLYSALLPGGAQWKAGRRGPALVAGVGTITLLTGSVLALTSFRDAGLSAQRDGRLLLGYAAAQGDVFAGVAASMRLEDANAARLRAAHRLRVPALGALLLYAWNLVDAYFFNGRIPEIKSARHDPGPSAFKPDPGRIAWRWEARF